MAKNTAADKITITVRNWDKYNHGRKDVKKASWFRLEHDIFTSQKLFGLSNLELFCFIFILSRCSVDSTASPTVDLAYAERVCRLDRKIFLSAISKLSKLGCVTYTLRARYVHVPLRTRHNEQDTTNSDPPLVDNSESSKQGDVELAVAYLNKATGRQFEASSFSASDNLTRLFTAGYTLKDVEAVICHRTHLWAQDAKMSAFLRPSTLFRLSNFQEYLGAAKGFMENFDALFGEAPVNGSPAN